MNIKKIKIKRYFKESLAQSLTLIVYKLTLDIVYSTTITDLYDYAGMHYSPYLYKYIVSFIIFLILVKPIINLYKDANPSATILLLINLIYFIPGCTFYSFSGISDKYFLFFASYWILMMLWFEMFTIPKLKSFDYKSKKFTFFFILTILVVCSLIISGLYNGFRLHFSIIDVYDLRFAQRKLNLPTLVSYFQPIAATLVPIAMVYCFVRKKILFGLILIYIQLLSFGFGGQKSTLLSLIVGLLSFFFYKKERVKLLVCILIVINIIALSEFLIFKISIVNAFVHDRVIFIPNLLSFQYYDYFNDHELLYWRESILRRFGLDSPYTLPVPRLIGKVYYQDITNNANNGMCGDAFSNFGWYSLLIYPFLVVAFLKFIDSCAEKIDIRVIFTASVIFAVGFTNGSFFGLLLTSGYIFACILLFIMAKQDSNTIRSNIY